MTTEHEEAVTEQLTEYQEQRDVNRRSVDATIWHTECASSLLEAKAQFWRALGAAVAFGSLCGVGWSVWSWVR